MNFKRTVFILQVMAVVLVLMALDMPLRATMALPVTSKPIESTVENLAWQAWIELPPEQKQQVKSRKVTPKSIFTLPLRVECPEGHKQVNTKCIPVVIGSNAVLVDLNALGLVVGNTQTDELYDYDDVDDEMVNPQSYSSEMQVGKAEKSVDGLSVELKPPAKDEPLKFNIFENEFNIFHEEPLGDYSSVSNEGMQSSEKEPNTTMVTAAHSNETLNSSVNITAINDLFSEASNIFENNLQLFLVNQSNPLGNDSYAGSEDFKIDAISLPVSGSQTQELHKLPIFSKDGTVQLIESVMNTETPVTTDGRDKKQDQQQTENDIATLLQTESFLPLFHQSTAATIKNFLASESNLLTNISLQEQNESSSDTIMLDVDEEMTTLSNIMEQDLELMSKQEFTRSVTKKPSIFHGSDSDDYENSENEEDENSTLEPLLNSEPLETTTAKQLDDTTIIETLSTSSSTPSLSIQQELKEILLQQEQYLKDFEELQRMRKGQKDQHAVLKKSKVEPVEVLSTTKTTSLPTAKAFTEASTSTTTTAISSRLPSETKAQDELTSTAETVTPLLTVHNEYDNHNNSNNDRFYYQHFAKHDAEEKQHSSSELSSVVATATATMTTKPTDIKKIPLTSENNLIEELRLINELVKDIQTATTSKTITKIKLPTATTDLNNEIQSSSSPSFQSESRTATTKRIPSTSPIWSKIMPLLTTTQMPESSVDVGFKSSMEGSAQNTDNDSKSNESTQISEFSLSTRSNRYSKLKRMNGFNNISERKALLSAIPITPSIITITPTTTKTTTTESASFESSSANAESSSRDNSYEPYWWLPLSWRLDKSTGSEKQQKEEQKSEEEPLLLRFWSSFYAPKSS